MPETLTEKLEDLIRFNKEDISTVLAHAVELGISKLWADAILEKYLSKRLSRKKTIQLLGLDSVKLAEKQQKAALEDIRWGLSNE